MNNISMHSYRDMEYTIKKIKKDAPDTLFIGCISYEPRTLCALKKLDNDYRADFGVLLRNKFFENFAKLKKHKKESEKILENKLYFRKTEHMSLSIGNPIQIVIEIDKILKSIPKERKNINITLDITGFPRNELLVLIYYLRHLSRVGIIRILYISPKIYGDWLTDGYRYFMIPPFFEGHLPTSEKKTALFILTGFEYERALALIDDIEPSILLLGKPNPGTSEDFRETSQDIIDRLKRIRRLSSSVHDIPANNPFKCRDRIEEIFQENPNYNFYVAPMGTKLEVLGTYLAYERNDNFMIVYPFPLAYNVRNYSEGCRDIYEIFLINGDDYEAK